MAQRGKHFNGIRGPPLESGFCGNNEGGLAAAQEGVGRLFQRQRRRQCGQACRTSRLFALFTFQQSRVFAIHRSGEAYITYGVFMRAENFRIVRQLCKFAQAL